MDLYQERADEDESGPIRLEEQKIQSLKQKEIDGVVGEMNENNAQRNSLLFQQSPEMNWPIMFEPRYFPQPQPQELISMGRSGGRELFIPQPRLDTNNNFGPQFGYHHFYGVPPGFPPPITPLNPLVLTSPQYTKVGLPPIDGFNGGCERCETAAVPVAQINKDACRIVDTNQHENHNNRNVHRSDAARRLAADDDNDDIVVQDEVVNDDNFANLLICLSQRPEDEDIVKKKKEELERQQVEQLRRQHLRQFNEQQQHQQQKQRKKQKQKQQQQQQQQQKEQQSFPFLYYPPRQISLPVHTNNHISSIDSTRSSIVPMIDPTSMPWLPPPRFPVRTAQSRQLSPQEDNITNQFQSSLRTRTPKNEDERNGPGGSRSQFLMKLQTVLLEPEGEPVLAWKDKLLHILDMARLVNEVMPQHFSAKSGCRFSSFSRQLNNYGFENTLRGTRFKPIYRQINPDVVTVHDFHKIKRGSSIREARAEIAATYDIPL